MVKVVRPGGTKNLLEGEEFTKVYFHTDKIVFAISSLLPGQRACLDKGHKDSDEVCYVIKGKIVLHLPGLDEYHELNAGDAILIPPDEAHYSVNVGEEMSVTAWACAPKL